jgi:dolichol-phosphate mannosyltransferase
VSLLHLCTRASVPGATSSSGRASRFALVGVTGLGVNQLGLLVGAEVFGVFYLAAAIVATQLSSTWNFLGADRWVFTARVPNHGVAYRYLSYMALNNAALLARLPALWLLVSFLSVHYLWANLITLTALFAIRYILGETWIWRAATVDEQATGLHEPTPSLVAPAKAPRHRYNIANILQLHSAVELPELLAFKTDGDTGSPDIRITISGVGKMPKLRTRFHRDGDHLSYGEQLGAVGANFKVSMGDPIEVRVSPLLALSRHVLYTNVIEALLRFVLVSKGYVLLHSACVKIDGRAALLSAQTDTGKTSTVIKLVRDHGYEFLSDDMTIIAPGGRAIHFPKPMTLSSHTMSSIRGEELTRRERARLAVQSRLHSKSGRSVGKAMGKLNIPIMSINSVVQAIIPPPKFHIDRLIPCEMGEQARIGHVFLMERGDPVRQQLGIDGAVPQLIENTDDAYGFPPFSTFAPHLRIGDDDYVALRAREEALLREALTGAQLWRLRVPGHGWAELLPAFFDAGENRTGSMRVEHFGGLVPVPVAGDDQVPTHTNLTAQGH